MPIYEYVADQCERQPVCSRRKEYFQHMSEMPLTACRECGAAVRRILSTFAARSGEFGVSAPDPTPLNMAGLRPPKEMPSDSEGGCSGHEH